MSDDWVTIKFKLLDHNYELLYSAAVFQGESLQVALNRACAFYEVLHRGKPGGTVSWTDGDGNERKVLILPAETPVFRWFPWFKLKIF